MKRIRGWLIAMPPPEPPPAPVRPQYPCGVVDCFEAQAVIEQDAQWTVVECPVHETRTRWETTARVAKEQQIIRVQDNWHQHGTAGPPKK